MPLRFTSLILFLSICCSGSAQDIFDAIRKGDLERVISLEKTNSDTIQKPNEAGFTPLIIAAYRGQTIIVDHLLKQHVKVDALSEEGTALMAACYKNDVEIATLLLEHDADPDIQTSQGSTALIFSVQSGNKLLVKLLLDKGAKKGLRDHSGKTALDHAKLQHLTEIVALLEQ